MTEFVDVATLASRVRSHTTVAVGGALFTRLPLRLIREVLRDRPRGLHYVAWGGGLPLEMFLEAGAVERLSFCFSSLDVFGLAPRFRDALENDAVAVEEWTALGMIQALQAAGQHVPFAVMQNPLGSDIGPQRAAADRRSAVVDRLPVDTLLLHAQRADTDGNVEIQGARGLDLSLIPASQQVLVTVEEVVARGRLGAPRSTIISRHLVSAVAVSPGGAYPSSSLPYYAADYRTIDALTDDPLSGEVDLGRLDRSRRAAQLAAHQVTHALASVRGDSLSARTSPGPEVDPTTAEIMMAWLARSYEPGSACSAGAVSPLALGSYLLAQRLLEPAPSIITTSGGYWDIGARPLLLGVGEVLDFASAPLHMGGDETYHHLYQHGLIDYEVVNVAQLDASAATNNQWVTSPSGRRIRLPGQGGMADVADMHRNFVLYQTRQSPLSMVEQVAVSSAARALHTPDDRRAAGYRSGRTAVVTNLAVFERDDVTGRLVPVSLHPGVDPERLLRETGFTIEVDVARSVPTTAQPSREVLDVIRHEIDPLGLRDLETVTARNRSALLDRVLTAEDDLIDAAAAVPSPSPSGGTP